MVNMVDRIQNGKRQFNQTQQMSMAHNRVANEKREKRGRTDSAQRIQRMTFQELEESERPKDANIFEGSSQVIRLPPIHGVSRDPLQEEDGAGKEVEREEGYREDELQEEQIQDPVQPNTELKLGEIIELRLGDYAFQNTFPIPKVVYIDNNNDKENELHEAKGEKIGRRNYYNNQLAVGGALVFPSLFKRVFFRLYLLVWIAAVFLLFLSNTLIFSSSPQHIAHRFVFLVLIIFALLLSLLLQWLNVRGRGSFTENQQPCRVYHHDGRNAEWVSLAATDLKSGHLFKVTPNTVFPIDCVLLHASSSLIHIEDASLYSSLVEPFSVLTLKETLIKNEILELPVSGYMSYEVQSADRSEFQISGALVLQQPKKENYRFSSVHMTRRGSVNRSSVEVVCLALEAGIDSLSLMELQYPRLLTGPEPSEGGVFQSIPLCNRVERILLLTMLLYAIIIAAGVLYGFLVNTLVAKQFFLSQSTYPLTSILIFYVVNSIPIIPLFLNSLIQAHFLLSSFRAQNNIKERKENQGLRPRIGIQQDSIQQLLIKDKRILQQLTATDILLTTIDTFRDVGAFQLQFIKVKEAIFNFSTNSLQEDAYTFDEIEFIKYFMLVALLTTEGREGRREKSIELQCRRTMGQSKESGDGMVSIPKESFRAKHLLTIEGTMTKPYRVTLFQVEGRAQNRALLLLRGDPQYILERVYGKLVKLGEDSRRYHEEKGHHVELIAKTTISLEETKELQTALSSYAMQAELFYANLERHFARLEPMGLLVFANQFQQEWAGSIPHSSALNKNVLSNLRPAKDLHASSTIPYMIVIAPHIHTPLTEFDAIHSITNMLVHPALFNFSLPEVADKIFHEPVSTEKLLARLREQKVVVWNGWDVRSIRKALLDLKNANKNILSYIERDQYAWVAKQVQWNALGAQFSYDAHKYADLLLTSRGTRSFLALIQLLHYDAPLARNALFSIILTQLSKAVFFFIFELAYIFYTRGTGLVLLSSTMHALIQIVLLFDVFYYANFQNAQPQPTPLKSSALRRIVTQIFKSIAMALIIYFIIVYALVSPADQSGTPLSNAFTRVLIGFSVAHVLILEKIFYNLGLSPYKVCILILQIILVYLGFFLISIFDIQFKNIIFYMFSGKLFLISLAAIWMCFAISFLRLIYSIARVSEIK